jgi:hypothetical protein
LVLAQDAEFHSYRYRPPAALCGLTLLARVRVSTPTSSRHLWANSILPDAILKDFNSTRILAFPPSDLRIFA